MIAFIKWRLHELARNIFIKMLVPLFRPFVWYLVFYEILRRPDYINYLRERINFSDKHANFFSNALECKSRQDIYTLAVKKALEVNFDGLWFEFGVWRGESINHIAKLAANKTIYGLDSFEGLPVDWKQGETKDSIISADYFKMHRLPRVKKNVHLIKGWFNETLPALLAKHEQNVVFMHIDSDVYESAKNVFDILGMAERIVPGTVIVFDEYYNYPRWQEGEYKAFQEFVQKHHVIYEFIAYNSHGEQAALVIKALDNKNVHVT